MFFYSLQDLFILFCLGLCGWGLFKTLRLPAENQALPEVLHNLRCLRLRNVLQTGIILKNAELQQALSGLLF